ncbi:hypothetical protein AN2712.2 [Aspergillus nidulans FGSC A4]|uniref:Endonuclease/exonuclease/phosphatase domain-containing protein n=1 Tax=Emericella nidulans (strain FGSC A4 / ATCC 38163 / CBS 112.46 / NRRL 194 / M139) TaxID=227321 RepID=Q5B9R8_EMENI|nr:hypothetical protein [Aspergillus nidulans FGSC A4]EAA63114.1 hypothetical protein AN2712.2 [Aspergillus nidulans FGSC A4]CBF84165.1 TPA: conserved hypothetical protein [Aspergillus nidulans FGSC A4]|eukprot:XP_660316.1 hypothetical protein AN2712.2 [Aspergillus nidulans FGSC A4]
MQAKQTAQRRLKQSNKTDHRIFLRLPASSSLRAIGPHGIRVTLAGKVPDGITQGKAFLLSEKAASLAGDGYFEIPTEYHQVIVSRIPKQLWSLDGWIDTTITDISMEAERITGIKPLMAKLSKHPPFQKSYNTPCNSLACLAYQGPLAPSKGLCNAPDATASTIQGPAALVTDASPADPQNKIITAMYSVSTAAAHMQQTSQNAQPDPMSRGTLLPASRKDALAAIRKAGRLAFQQEQKKAESSKQQADTHSLPEPISPDITTIYTAGLTIINVYRPPNNPVAPAGAGSTPSTLSTLLGYTPPENTILAGDFNTRHPFWQPDTESHTVTPGATGLLDWLDAHELELRLEPGTPTRGPNTLDLVFSNIPLRALVEDHLKTPSDHATIGIILEQDEPSPIHKLGSTNWEKARTLASPPDPTLPINLLAEQLVQISQLAIQGASRYNTCRLPRTPW